MTVMALAYSRHTGSPSELSLAGGVGGVLGLVLDRLLGKRVEDHSSSSPSGPPTATEDPQVKRGKARRHFAIVYSASLASIAVFCLWQRYEEHQPMWVVLVAAVAAFFLISALVWRAWSSWKKRYMRNGMPTEAEGSK